LLIIERDGEAGSFMDANLQVQALVLALVSPQSRYRPCARFGNELMNRSSNTITVLGSGGA
jgi:hypothetical protein